MSQQTSRVTLIPHFDNPDACLLPFYRVHVDNRPCRRLPQTKMLVEPTFQVSECVFYALFKGASTRFGLRIVENASLEKHSEWLDFDRHIYAPQTKILEDRTKDRACIFEALFKGLGTSFGRLVFEKYIEK